MTYFDYKPWHVYSVSERKLIASYRFRNEAESHAQSLNRLLGRQGFISVHEPETALAA